ncbi:MAG TPA: N-acetylglucosamine-6-phosphate deacetylase [Chitinophagaceae bacterium]|nr:N-acetylglucosamine-6-phosphate deacetylase [Chitinophagaceae bacterium]
MRHTALQAAKIFDGDTWVFEKVVLVNDNKIEGVVAQSEVPSHYTVKNSAGFIAPAFIDVQIYGAFKKLFAAYPEPESLRLLNDYCTAGGAPMHLPTVATNAIEVFKKCIDAVRHYWAKGGKGVYGLHLEGPWINNEKRGAHITAFIHAPTIDEVTDLLQYGAGVIKMITLAPEVCSDAVLKLIQQHNIVISAGHSNATYGQAMQAFDNGITTATHLYNAMSPLQHRAPGLVGAVFNHATTKCSCIPDGYHVDYAALKIAKKVMGDRLFAITDAVTETTISHYQHQLDGDKYVSNGILSGSALTMHKAFVNLVTEVDVPIEEALRMCSRYQGEMLGIMYGRLKPGYAAQFVVIGTDLELLEVISG